MTECPRYSIEIPFYKVHLSSHVELISVDKIQTLHNLHRRQKQAISLLISRGKFSEDPKKSFTKHVGREVTNVVEEGNKDT